jgi:hypothetical protein
MRTGLGAFAAAPAVLCWPRPEAGGPTMSKRVPAALACLALVIGAEWLGSRGEGGGKERGWQ